MKCPVCDRENTSILCRQCGFDSSRDYGKYPTFGPVGRAPSVSALRKQWQQKQKPAKPVQPEKIIEPFIPPKSVPPKQPQISSKPPAHTAPPPPAAPKNKWVAFFLCFLFGVFGAHKFYEGKKGMGIVYLFTFGLCGYGWFFDCISLLFKPNPYYPRRK